MEIGFHFVNFDVPGGLPALPTTLVAAARAAEQAGASSFTMADHFFQMDNLWPAEAPMLEIYSCLGYLAGQTERIKLVVMVSGGNVNLKWPQGDGANWLHPTNEEEGFR